MDAGGEAVVVGQPAEQGDELLAFDRVEDRAELGLMAGRGVHDLSEHGPPLAGEVQRAYPAVAHDRAPFQ
jgi:hypothetical protein